MKVATDDPKFNLFLIVIGVGCFGTALYYDGPEGALGAALGYGLGSLLVAWLDALTETKE